MAKLQIDSVLCHANVSIDLEPGITLITGKNTAGKTSMARIIAALTAHDANPAGISASAGKSYVLDGVLEGQARLDEVVWRPPQGISAPALQEPRSTPHAVGLVDFSARGGRSAKERAERWEGIFMPDDARAILEGRWKHDEKQLVAILDMIASHGWEKANSIYEQKRVEAKRRWEGITGGGRYGKSKAAAWVPKDWRTELESANEDDLQAEIVNIKDQINGLTYQQAVDQSKIDEAKAILAGPLPEAEAKHKELSEEYKKAQAAQKEKANEMAALKSEHNKLDQKIADLNLFMNSTAPYECPHCNGGLKLSNGKIEAWYAPGPQELKDASNQLELAIDRKTENMKEVAALAPSLEAIQKKTFQLMSDGIELKGRIETLKEQAKYANLEASEGNTQLRGMLEEKHREAMRSLESFRAWRNAAREHDNIIELDAVCQLLGPTGARSEHMRERMDKVRSIMRNAQKITNWEEITIADDYGISSNGRGIALCAENEQLKAQWLCQIAAGLLTKSEFIVLDQGDLLRDESWSGLVELLNRLVAKRPHLHIVLCATSTEPPEGWAHVNL